MRKLWFIPLLLFMLTLDSPVREALTRIQDQDLRWFMGWVSYLGKGWIQAIPCLILMSAGLLLKKYPGMKEAGKNGIFAIAAAGVLSQTIKHLIGRPRPKIMDIAGISLGPSFASDYDSFPSGHAASAFALASSLSFYYPRMKYPLYAYGILVIFSRVYLGAHFLSDIVAGTALGLWIGWVMTHKSGEDIRRMVSKYSMVLAIAVLSIFLFFFKLGGPALFDVDEAVFSESSREMIETGDWITPQYNYSNRYDKPVLFYWMQASAYKIFGVSEFSARFWSASLAIALVFISYYFIRKAGNARWAALGAFILVTSFEVIILSHAAITDMTLTFFISSSLICFFLGYSSDSHAHKKWWYWCMYISMALAVLTKGPVGIVIPGMVIGLFLLYRGQVREVLMEMKIVSGAVIFLLAAMPWYIIEISINGWEYIDAFFIKHNFTRFTGVVSGHSGPVYYFIPVILLAFFPWSLFIPFGLVKSFSVMKQKTEHSRKESIILFASLWFLTVFIFFSFSRTKLPGYIAPLSPAVAIMVGWLWDRYISSGSGNEKGMKISMVCYSVIGLLLSAGLALLPFIAGKSASITRHLNEPLNGLGGFYMMSICIFTGVVVSILFLWRKKKVMSFAVMVGMMTLAAYLLIGKIVPTADRYLQSSLKDFSRIAGSQLANGQGELIIFGLNKPSILFYAGRSAVVLKSNEKDRLAEVIASSERFFIITKGSQIEDLLKMPEIQILNHRGGYALLTNQKKEVL